MRVKWFLLELFIAFVTLLLLLNFALFLSIKFYPKEPRLYPLLEAGKVLLDPYGDLMDWRRGDFLAGCCFGLILGGVYFFVMMNVVDPVLEKLKECLARREVEES